MLQIKQNGPTFENWEVVAGVIYDHWNATVGVKLYKPWLFLCVFGKADRFNAEGALGHFGSGPGYTHVLVVKGRIYGL